MYPLAEASSGKSGTNLGPIDLSSFSIVFSCQQIILIFQEYIFSLQ